MNDLSHWNFAEQFSGYDAAALILGIEPRESAGDEHRVRVVADRLKLDYERALGQAKFETRSFDDLEISKPPAGLLVSVKLDKLWRDAAEGMDAPLDEWVFNQRLTQFDNQEFARHSISEWLISIAMEPVYRFDRSQPVKLSSDLESGIDPADLPEELQAANIAFRAITNGYGEGTATFKNRLIGYLEKNFVDLSSEAVQRIATVANPDKMRGRKKVSG